MTNDEIMKLFEQAESLADQRRLLPALQAWEQARSLAKTPFFRVWATFNLGVTNWALLGNGVVARREFLACIQKFEELPYGADQNLKVMHANVVENAMLCALSFEEFESLSEKLRKLTTGVPILGELVPKVLETRERGEPWFIQLFGIASGYYNRNDPKTDVGRYGEAKSTYHLILANRRELRLSREFWRMAIVEFCALSPRIASDCSMKRGGDKDSNSPEEFIPILTDAIPFADEYLDANSGDDIVKELRHTMIKNVEIYRQRWVSLGSNPADLKKQKTIFSGFWTRRK